uniref:nucleotidyltransferase domain-containing protein n=1 Tax=Acetatifactor sp. TaxID=1872090 RepID=UPI0040574FBA
MGNVITKEKALGIVSEFKDEITGWDSVGVLAIYLIGSLGGGYYRPGQSDIDTVIIIEDMHQYLKKKSKK